MLQRGLKEYSPRGLLLCFFLPPNGQPVPPPDDCVNCRLRLHGNISAVVVSATFALVVPQGQRRSLRR